MSFNLNPPQWEPNINRPQAPNNNGRGSGGGGGYAGGGHKREDEKKVSNTDLFVGETVEEESDVDVNFTTFLRVVSGKIAEFVKKKKNWLFI